MLRYLFLLFILLFAVWLGLKIQADPGYALFAYKNWTVEMPLWFAGLSILGCYILFYAFFRLFHNAGMLKLNIIRWQQQRKQKKAYLRTRKGLLQLAEGKWASAEKLLIRGADSKNPLINYLSAAKAAQEQGALERRDVYLKQAELTTPNAEVAVGLAQADLQQNYQQLEASLTTLHDLQQIAPHHPAILQRQKEIYLARHDWENLNHLLPSLKKYHVGEDRDLQALEIKIYRELLLAPTQNAESLTTLWQTIPKKLKQERDILTAYIAFLLKVQRDDEAIALLKDALKRQWEPDYITLFTQAHSSLPAKQLAVAENFLKLHPDDPTLLLSVGILAKRLQLWGKARDYLQLSVEKGHRNQAYFEYGELLLQQHDKEQALEIFRHGLKSCIVGITQTRELAKVNGDNPI